MAISTFSIWVTAQLWQIPDAHLFASLSTPGYIYLQRANHLPNSLEDKNNINQTQTNSSKTGLFRLIAHRTRTFIFYLGIFYMLQRGKSEQLQGCSENAILRLGVGRKEPGCEKLLNKTKWRTHGVNMKSTKSVRKTLFHIPLEKPAQTIFLASHSALSTGKGDGDCVQAALKRV